MRGSQWLGQSNRDRNAGIGLTVSRRTADCGREAQVGGRRRDHGCMWSSVPPFSRALSPQPVRQTSGPGRPRRTSKLVYGSRGLGANLRIPRYVMLLPRPIRLAKSAGMVRSPASSPSSSLDSARTTDDPPLPLAETDRSLRGGCGGFSRGTDSDRDRRTWRT